MNTIFVQAIQHPNPDGASLGLPHYFEVGAALKKQPKNSALKREFKELKKNYEFLKKDAERKLRHEALRQSRLALEPKPPEPEEGDAADQT